MAVIPVAVAPVGPVTVVTEAAFHLGPRAAAVSFVAESLVRARLHHSVWKERAGEASRRSQICFEVTED